MILPRDKVSLLL